MCVITCLPTEVTGFPPPPAGYTPLHVAAGAGRTSAVTDLLGRGADPNLVSHQGDTPLHLACQNGHAGAVSVLVLSKCTLSSPESDGCTGEANLHYINLLLIRLTFHQVYSPSGGIFGLGKC